MVFKNVIHSGLLVFLSIAIAHSQVKTSAFKSAQLKYAKVKDAYDAKWPALKDDMKTKGINAENYDIYLRAFKYEKKMEVWLKNSSETSYTLFRTYDICASSGDLGPKRKEGDGQVPEGFYTIDLFNPTSNYYLSMRVSYPNSSDLILKQGKNAGGAIMVHGNCVTIGCMPMTDDKIKELYVLCLEAKNRNRVVKIDIFPIKLNASNLKLLEANYPKEKINFWNSLKPAYDYFEKNHATRKVFTDAKGAYFFKE
ncbi:MAG: L,D-transpeptidase family protein [Bacteroidetes bacterium]|nr:L,D-transpeptidase family protein [Bacteroidota bacterium]